MQNNKNLGLRVDVDFEVGLLKGVPYLLDLFSKNGIKATFYVAMGPDGFCRHRHRIKTDGYMKRITTLNPCKMIFNLGIPYIAKQFIGRAGNVGQDHPAILKSILAQGHELAVHGYDHFWWAEHIWDCEDSKTEIDMKMSLAAFKRIVGVDSSTWASPNWRCSTASLKLVDSYNFSYAADCRGKSPFFPRISNWQAKTIQLPVTLPCLHEIKGYLKNGDRDSVISEFMSRLSDTFNIWCIHDYYEGILERRLFSGTVSNIMSKGYKLIPVKELLSAVNLKDVASCEVIRHKLPGGRGEVSCQNET